MRTTAPTFVAAVNVAAETGRETKKRFMSITTVAQGMIEPHLVAVGAADPQLLVVDYTNDAKLFMPTVSLCVRAALHALCREFFMPHSKDGLTGITIAPTHAHEHGTTVMVTAEGAKLPFCAT
jgi:hypothetical protein